ncbi:HK97 family phage major capsid protein [Brevundimonas bullata]|uniref:HK97 family phage major capsid protein n=1 Tax=Brevundimonas bullata TaxID=13160 RepID=A0A7W7N3I5_9CAUL|nr:phage major capsid protein [Brevundimonas bullata]MBB4798530.1 HK97 family phage major capsid protein [Brevundimonas bullata]MBB6383155.1 HK97 family phage major capsid protein [Brevundimonas bullata]
MKETKTASASPEARAALHEMMAAFEAFKGANDARLDEIEKKASADTLLEEKVARIDQAVAGAQARLDRALSEGRRPMVEGGVAPSTASRSPSPFHGEEKSAWDGYMKSGQSYGLELKAGLSSASNSAGYVVPPETERAIERRLMAGSPMREIATVRTVGSGVFRKPVSTAGVTAGWVAETAARPETDPATLSLLEFSSADLYACPAATQSLLDDALIDLDEWLAAEVEDAFAAQETAAFVNGDGVNKPKGFLAYATASEGTQTWGQIGTVASGAAGAFASASPVDKLIDLIYAPKAQYRPNGRFVMNRRTVSAVRKFKDADGNYVWSPATRPGETASLLGYPVTEIETMPDVAANSLSIAFGDFARGYLIVDRAGVRVLRDPYSAKPYVLFYTTKRVGGGVQNFDAIKLMKFAAT